MSPTAWLLLRMQRLRQTSYVRWSARCPRGIPKTQVFRRNYRAGIKLPTLGYGPAHKSMKYKLAIFDFDGTLADSFPFFLETINELANIHKFKRIDRAELDTLRRYSARQMLGHLNLPLWKTPFVGRSFKRIMAGKIDQIPLFAGVETMLRALAENGVALSTVTSNSHNNVRRVLTPESMDLMVHPQCGTSLFGKPARLRNILRHTGIRPNETIYVGDEIRDMEAASAACIHFGAVTWGYTHADALLERAPEEVFSSVEEITRKIIGQIETVAA
jgi:phosphoglycolate phosphatase